MDDVREQLERAMAAMEAQRETLGDAVVDAALAAFREKLAALNEQGEDRMPLENRPLRSAHHDVIVLCAGVADLTRFQEGAEPSGSLYQGPLWPRLEAIINRSGGTIEQRSGDSVTVIFGAQAAHADDAERAVRAALELRDEARRPASGTGPVQLRAGLNTGPAGSSGPYPTLEETVWLAARLHAAAGPGEVLISAATFHAVRGIFDMQALDLAPDENLAVPGPVYRVRGLRPRVSRLGGLPSRPYATLVGRDAERSQLLAAFAAARDEHRLRLLTITGEAGVGKSRLAQEFLNWITYTHEPCVLLRGRGDWQLNRLPYALLRELLTGCFNIADSDSASAAREKLLRGVEGWLGTDADRTEVAHWIGHVAGYDFVQSQYLSGRLDDPRRARQLAFQALNRFVAAVARQTPLVILVDDLQWADDSSLDWLDSLARSNPGGTVLLVGLARPALFERRPNWGERWANHTRLSLLPLNDEQSALLAEQLFRTELITPASYAAPTTPRRSAAAQPVDPLVEAVARPVRKIVEKARGNPFFIEELAQSLVEDCIFIPSGGKPGEPPWRVDTARLEAGCLPCSLAEALQVRLDSLPDGEREVLLRAAVVGPVFWESAVHGLLEMDDGPDAAEDGLLRVLDLPGALRALQERGLIEKHDASAFEHTDEYAFKNALLYEVTYGSQLVRCRQQDHARVAVWLAAQSGERVERFSAVIARHYERAEERLLAADWYGLAALQAGRSTAPESAQLFFSRALELLPDEPVYFGQRVQLYKGVWDIQWWQARYAEALATGQALLATAEARGDLVVQAAAWNRIAAVQNRQGEYQAALRSVQRAERLARAGGAAREVVLALFHRGVTLYRLGDAAAALEAGERALAFNQSLFGQSGASEADAPAAASVASADAEADADAQPEQAAPEGPAALEDAALAVGRQGTAGDDEARRETARILNLLAMINQRAGRYAEAEKDYRQVLALQRERGDRGAVMASLNSLGTLASQQGDYRLAAGYFQQALNLAQEIGFHELDLVCMNNLAGAQVELGEFQQAEARLREVLSRVVNSTWFLLTEAYRSLAVACLGLERCEEALSAGLRALELARQGHLNENIGKAWRVLGHIAAGFGPKLERAPVVVDGHECSAHACYAASLQIFVEMGMAHEQARTARELANYEMAFGDRREGARLWQEARDLFARLGLKIEVERMDRMAAARTEMI